MGGEKANVLVRMHALVHVGWCLRFDTDLPNESKTRRMSTKSGSTFQDTWMDRD